MQFAQPCVCYARAGKIRGRYWGHHDADRAGDVERLRAEMAGTFTRRHPDRARAFGILFPNRHLHRPQHLAQFAPLDLLNLSALMAAPRKQAQLERHITELLKCRRCPRMQSPPVSGGAITSDVIVIGQAPGPREPVLQRPFAHTAGKTLFRWLEEFCGMNEATVRSKIYFAAVCRCFPGKNSSGTDRVPAPDEIHNCSSWMNDEIRILRPRLIIPVGRLAIRQFIDCAKLEKVIGRKFRVERARHSFDVIPLPHPSGASPWHKIPPGRGLTERALRLIARHPAICELVK